MLGYGSRRKVEQLVTSGKVSVNGTVVRDLATRVELERDTIAVAGETLPKRPSPRLLAFYKPKGVLSTWKDEKGRRCLIDFFPQRRRLIAVGRLDRRSEGLILLTTDGELAHSLMHPSSRVQRTYELLVQPEMKRADWMRIARGVMLTDGPVFPLGGEILHRRGDTALLRITIAEGRNRELRRLMESLGYDVLRLKRVAFGGIDLGKLKPGETRELDSHEMTLLRKQLIPTRQH